jgi:hypothetical protein
MDGRLDSGFNIDRGWVWRGAMDLKEGEFADVKRWIEGGGVSR